MNKQSTIREWLICKDFTLALSSSFFGFYSHAGFIAALLDEGIFPKKITGASAGALVAAAFGSGLSANELKELLFSVKKNDFWDPAFGPGLLKGEKFYGLLQKYLVSDFSQTSIPVEAAVFDLKSLKTKFLSSGDLARAVQASCAVPLMFHPVKIDGRLYVDGGVFHKSGINVVSSSERVFCVYLENNGLMGIYENKTSFKKIDEQHKVLCFKNLPKVDPNSLDTGKLAYAEAYRRTKQSLGLYMSEYFILNATS